MPVFFYTNWYKFVMYLSEDDEQGRKNSAIYCGNHGPYL